MRNSIKSRLWIGVFLLFAIILASPHAFATQKIIEADGSYLMGDGLEENQFLAKQRAEAEAKRRASESAALYLESVSEVNMGTLMRDEIRAVSATILEIKERPKFTLELVGGTAVRYNCHIVALVDTDNINQQLLQDKQAMQEMACRNKELEEMVARLTREREELNASYAAATTEAQRQQIRQQSWQNDQEFLAAQWLELGNKKFDQKDYDGAKEDYEKAIALHPQYAWAYYNLGNVYKDKGDNQTAIEYYQTAISINSQFAEAYTNLGIVCFMIGDNQTAIGCFQKAISINPQYAVAYYDLGFVYDDIGDKGKAIENYQKVISINPRYAKAYANLGAVYGEIGDYQKAIECFQQVIAINPQDASAYRNRALAYERLHRYKEAKRDYAKAYELTRQMKR